MNLTMLHMLGYNVIKVRFIAIIFGGSMCALAGSYISMCYAPMWQEGMTAERAGLPCTEAATWKPERILIGAYILWSNYFANESSGIGYKNSGQFFNMALMLQQSLFYIFSSNKLRIKLIPAS